MVATTVKATVPDVASVVMKRSAGSAAMVGVRRVAGRVAINEGLARDWADGDGTLSIPRTSSEGCFVTSPCPRSQG